MALFHLVGRDAWERDCAGDVYVPESLEREGFIHFSTDRQLLATAARFFAGRDDVLVISVRPDRLRAAVRWADADGDTFPHLHGPLNLDAVVEILPLPLAADGSFDLPPELAPWRPYFVR